MATVDQLLQGVFSLCNCDAIYRDFKSTSLCLQLESYSAVFSSVFGKGVRVHFAERKKNGLRFGCSDSTFCSPSYNFCLILNRPET